MCHRRYEKGQGEFDHMREGGYNGCRGGIGSLFGLIFSIVSFTIALAFRIIGVVFQAFFGVLSGIGGGSHREKRRAEGNAPGFAVDNETGQPEGEKPKGRPIKEQKNNIRDFKKPEHKEQKSEAAAAASDKKHEGDEVHNKDIYIILFILTMIPGIVALSMGELLYAGIIGAAGFGLMVLAGIISGMAARFGRKAEAAEAESREEPERDETVEGLIKEAFEKLFQIRKDIDKVKDAGVKAEIEAICGTAEKIIGEVRINPEGLVHVRKFFYYYLDAFGEIVRKYIRLTNFEEDSSEVGKLVEETERSFADISAIFKELCEKLLEKDMLNLKAEINVIKNSN